MKTKEIKYLKQEINKLSQYRLNGVKTQREKRLTRRLKHLQKS